MTFELLATDSDSSARAGILETDHGRIETPIFMPVGTQGAVKGVHMRELENDVDAQIILGNTYHLYLRPGMEVIQQAGGLHKFNGWKRPILTDSGGYQVFSLSKQRKITEEGAHFRSHIDGSKHLFSPEHSMWIQRVLGSDILMAFDECPPYPSTYEYTKNSMHLTHRWLDRCISYLNENKQHYDHTQALFPIVQGGTYKDLRIDSAKAIADRDCPGNAIGGLSVGEPTEELYDKTGLVCEHLPKDKPRYLMGVGTPANLLECIALGVDMFDCVMPTRNGRHGMVYTTEGIMNIKNQKWKHTFEPIDKNLDGYVSSFYSKAYLRHLFVAGENLAQQIISIQNLSLYLWLMKEARKEIMNGTFMSWKEKMTEQLMQRI
jgi:queuine tRNA-ribosyltransferase